MRNHNHVLGDLSTEIDDAVAGGWVISDGITDEFLLLESTETSFDLVVVVGELAGLHSKQKRSKIEPSMVPISRTIF